jgi:hypothetical protein
MPSFFDSSSHNANRDFGNLVARAFSKQKYGIISAVLKDTHEGVLFEGGRHSRAWLNSPSAPFRDDAFATILGLSIGIPLVGKATRMLCDVVEEPCSVYKHVLACKTCGAGYRTGIHDAIRDGIMTILTRASSKAVGIGRSFSVEKEKHLKNANWQYKPLQAATANAALPVPPNAPAPAPAPALDPNAVEEAIHGNNNANENMRADIHVSFPMLQHASIAFDVVTAAPRPLPDGRFRPKGDAAASASAHKKLKYARSWLIDDHYKLIPVAVEMSGYIDDGDRTLLRDFFQSIFSFPPPPLAGTPPPPDPSPDAAYYLRQTLHSISHSLHRAIGFRMTTFRNHLAIRACAAMQTGAGAGPAQPTQPQPPQPTGAAWAAPAAVEEAPPAPAHTDVGQA